MKEIESKEKGLSDDKILNDLLNAWNLSVCPSNAMLGGYLANYVMFYVQRKQKPLHNFLFFDMWSCEALEVLMRNEKDEQNVNGNLDSNSNSTSIHKETVSNNQAVDISKLSVNKQKKQSNKIVLLDDSDEDEDGDIDLTK